MQDTSVLHVTSCSDLIYTILFYIQSISKSFQRFYMQDTSVLGSYFIQLVVLPDEGPISLKHGAVSG